jgi:hypothetical protein
MVYRAILLLLCTVLLGPGFVHSQEILKQIQAPGSEARGLAWDGQSLWCADASADKIYQLDPDDGHILSSFNITLDYQYGGLGWSPDGYLWVTDLRDGTSAFLKIDPSNGGVVSSFHCPGS